MRDKTKGHLFDNPANIKRAIYIQLACCAVLFGLDFVIHRHSLHPWETLLGFYGLFGFIAYVCLVFAARELRKVLMRKESYYDD